MEVLWKALTSTYADKAVDDVCADTVLVRMLLALFAIADEASAGIGWDVAPDGSGRTQEIGLPDRALGVLMTLQSKPKHQNTLDNRSDKSLSRQLTLRTVVPLFTAERPNWI